MRSACSCCARRTRVRRSCVTMRTSSSQAEHSSSSAIELEGESPPQFVSILAATAVPAPKAARELLLEQVHPCRGTEGELMARKQRVYATERILHRNNHLRALLAGSDASQPLVVRVDAEALSIEAVTRALEWQAAPPAERVLLLEHLPWQQVSALLHAASWMGCRQLLKVCEAKLCMQLRLENVRRPHLPHRGMIAHAHSGPRRSIAHTPVL